MIARQYTALPSPPMKKRGVGLAFLPDVSLHQSGRKAAEACGPTVPSTGSAETSGSRSKAQPQLGKT